MTYLFVLDSKFFDCVSSQTARQRNIKQKFVALLKKFKVTEHGSDGIDDENLINQRIDHDSVSADCAAEIEDLFDQLEVTTDNQ